MKVYRRRGESAVFFKPRSDRALVPASRGQVRYLNDVLSRLADSRTFFIARLHFNLFKHVLPAKRLGHTLGLKLSQRVILINGGNFKQTIVQHHHTQGSQLDARSDLYFVHVMNLEMTCLFDPIFDERIAQGMFGFGLRKIRPLDN